MYGMAIFVFQFINLIDLDELLFDSVGLLELPTTKKKNSYASSVYMKRVCMYTYTYLHIFSIK